ncbi:MAG: hypothetical protein ACLR6J_09285 [Parabacteroides merdae]
MSARSGNAKPLVLADGIETLLFVARFLPPKSRIFLVLKDAASASIYGSRAAHV